MLPSFAVNKNGSNQTGLSSGAPNLITWGNELWDVGDYFASDAWVPPAGKVMMMARVYLTGTISQNVSSWVAIYKDGSLFVRTYYITGPNYAQPEVVAFDSCDGSNSYNVYALVSGSSLIANGGVTMTQFGGHWFAP